MFQDKNMYLVNITEKSIVKLNDPKPEQFAENEPIPGTSIVPSDDLVQRLNNFLEGELDDYPPQQYGVHIREVTDQYTLTHQAFTQVDEEIPIELQVAMWHVTAHENCDTHGVQPDVYSVKIDNKNLGMFISQAELFVDYDESSSSWIIIATNWDDSLHFYRVTI
jgi:hypothetical protein